MLLATCGCTGRNYKKKKLYRSEREAQEQAEFAKIERQVTLTVYPCPYGRGYHLTSK